MIVELLPEAIGLVLTPAAVVGCVLLLESSRPYANSLSFAAAFLILYGALSLMVLAIGDAVVATPDTAQVKGVISLTVGVLFLGIGAVILLHHRQTGEGPPKWVHLLETARPTGAFIAGTVLAIANPNVFLLLSGLGTVVQEGTTRGDRALGAGFLLGAVALDFLVPILIYAMFGDGARERLDAAKRWMVAHDRKLTLGILFSFGAVFALRGLRALA